MNVRDFRVAYREYLEGLAKLEGTMDYDEATEEQRRKVWEAAKVVQQHHAHGRDNPCDCVLCETLSPPSPLPTDEQLLEWFRDAPGGTLNVNGLRAVCAQTLREVAGPMLQAYQGDGGRPAELCLLKNWLLEQADELEGRS